MEPTPTNVTEITLQQLISQLDDQASTLSKSDTHHIISDIGASNCRIGIVPGGGLCHEKSLPSKIEFCKFPANSVPELTKVLLAFVESIGVQRLGKVVAAVVNLPGPCQGFIGGPIANYKGDSNKDKMVDLRRMPAELFPRNDKLYLMNDLVACAHGVIACSETGAFSATFKPMWTGSSSVYESTLGDGNCVIVAPGTGLGTALIQHHESSAPNKYTVLPLEFGHTNISTRDDRAFFSRYSEELYNKEYEVEYDDICSGRGLERFHRFINGDDVGGLAGIAALEIGTRASREASAGTRTGVDRRSMNEQEEEYSEDISCAKAMRLYNKYLMHLISGMSMCFLPRTVILCGDNIVRNKPVYDNNENIEEMKTAMAHHSMERHGFMSRPHVLRQVHVANLSILGCAFVSQRIGQVGMEGGK